MARVGLVDADLVAYTAASVGQTAHDLGFDDGPLVHTDVGAAQDYIAKALEGWVDDLGLDRVEMCWSDDQRDANWRFAVLPSYKHNRGGDKPVLYWPLVYELRAEYPSHTLPGLEGDDVMGILQTGPFGRRHDTVILSIDKDMYTVPGELYDWHREFHGVVTPDEAAHHHMTQTLTGDTTDGYKGLPRCGTNTAAKILDGLTGYVELWPAVRAEYERKGHTVQDALQQARVARILHRSDWHAGLQAVIPWLPPES